MRFNPDDYEDVATRLKRFKSDHPDSRIITHALSDPNLKDWVVIRAEVYLTSDAAAPAASGIAQEHPGQGANQTSWWENCETSAIGRALANCGYGGDLRASREEMQKTERPAYHGQSQPRPQAPRPAAPTADNRAGEIGSCFKCNLPVRFAQENGKQERYDADGGQHFRSCGKKATGYEEAAADVDPFEEGGN